MPHFSTIDAEIIECFQDLEIWGQRLPTKNTDAAPEMQLIQAELLTIKIARCAWNLIHEELDSRWQTLHPDADLIRRT
jgi:hypothetical protein